VFLALEETEPAPGDFGGLHYFAVVFEVEVFAAARFAGAAADLRFGAAFAFGLTLVARAGLVLGLFSSDSRSLYPVVKASPIALARFAASSTAAFASGFSRSCLATANPAAMPVANQKSFFMLLLLS
jgi:hypothetical protein